MSITAMAQRAAVRKSREAPRATNVLTLRRPFRAALVKFRGCVWRTCLNTGLPVFLMKRLLPSAQITWLSLVDCCSGHPTRIHVTGWRPQWLT